MPRRATIKKVALPFTLKLIALTTLLPEELSFYVGGLRLTLTRVIFLAITPILLVKAAQMLAVRRLHVMSCDAFVLMTGIWMFIGFANVDGMTDSLAHMGPIVLEFCVGYFAMRIFLIEHGQALSFIELLSHAIAVVALLGLLDPLTGHWFVRDLAGELTGYREAVIGDWGDAYRSGLLRASGTVEHPILFGITCTFGLLLSATSQMSARRLTMAACSFGLLASLSSAPIQGAAIGFGLLFYDKIFSRVRLRWWLLIFSCATGFAILKAFVNAPVDFIFEHLLFNGSSYWSRLYEWQTAGEVVLQSPWFGVANHWSEIAKRTDAFGSIDSIWLATALTAGMPASILLGLSVVSATFSATSGPGTSLTEAEAKLATTLSVLMVIVVFLGFTVHIWGTTWVLLGILIGVRAHLGALARTNAISLSMLRSAKLIAGK